MTALLLILGVVLLVVVMSQRSDADERFRKLESDLAALRRQVWELRGKAGLSKGKAEDDEAPEAPLARPLPPRRPPPVPAAPPPAAPRPIPAPVLKPAPPLPPVRPLRPAAPAASRPAPSPRRREPAFELPSIDWERFTGVNLFAWLGGLALFLAAGFFVKYSIDANLLPPELRLALSALLGVGLIAGSSRFEPQRYAVLRQSLAAGGVGVLFAVILAATLYYRFIGHGLGFALLALTALAAFALAAAQKAPATAVLGALGAWIALLLVEPGQAGLLPLFAYLAVVVMSLHQVARRLDLAWLGAFGTLGTLLALLAAQNSVGADGPAWATALVWTGQLALFTAAIWDLPWDPRKHPSLAFAAAASYGAALIAGFTLLGSGGLAPGLSATASLALLLLVGMRQKAWSEGALMGALFSWMLLLAWALTQPQQAASLGGLAVLLAYGLVGGLGPVLLLRDPELAKAMRHWLLVYPVALAILGLGLAIAHPALPALFWPADFVLQLLGLGLALIAGGVIVALLCLLGLLISVAIWLSSPLSLALLAGPLFFVALLLGGIALVAAVLWLAQNLGPLRARMGLAEPVKAAEKSAAMDPELLLPWLSAAPVLGAFLLLAMVFHRLAGQSPHAGMATALSLIVLGLGLAKRLRHQAVGAVTALSSVLPLAAWALYPAQGMAMAGLGWTLGLWLLLTLAPFFLYRPEDDWSDAWCGHALAVGLLSLLAMALARSLFTPQQGAPILLGLIVVQLIAVARLVGSLDGKPARDKILAFWGSGLLLLVSALPVLLLDRGWLGLALVFEGAGLVWLHGRVRHPLLPMGGLGFALWGLGSMALGYGAMRGEAAEPMLNPAFMAFAAATLLQTFAAFEARRQAHSPQGYPQRWRLGQRWTAVLLGFYLLNLGIAEFFAGGPSSGFDLRSEGRWAQNVLYTLSWALVGGGLWAFLRQRSIMAWAGLALLGVAVFRALALPFLYPGWVPSLGPWVNLAWLVYVPMLAILAALRVWELRRGGGAPARAILWALLAVAFLAFKVETSSTLQTGASLSLFTSDNAPHALGQAAGWTLFSLALLLWPRSLEPEFRLFGLGLLVAGLLRAAWLPLGYASAWPDAMPLLNGVWLLLAGQSLLLAWLAKRAWPQGHWPLQAPASMLMGALALALGFFTVNVGVAQFFREAGTPLHLAAQGSLGHRLGNSVSWMFYGLALMGLGIRSGARSLRMAGLALMALTSFKVFLGDLRHLEQLYRVAAFVGLAVSLLLVSYLYQRFVSQPQGAGKEG